MKLNPSLLDKSPRYRLSASSMASLSFIVGKPDPKVILVFKSHEA